MTAVVSRAAGELIAAGMQSGEPAELVIAGTVQGRYFVDKDAVQLGARDAAVTLYDAWKVLNGGAINHSFKNATLRDVIEHVYNAVDDRSNVLTGLVPAENDIGSAAITGPFGAGGGIAGTIAGVLAGFVETQYALDVVDTSISFDKVTPAEAMMEIERQFGLLTWVDKKGRFHYTLPSLKQYATLGVLPGDRDIRIKEWNVSRGSGFVSKVILRGPFEYAQANPFTARFEKTYPKDVYAYGIAEFGGVSGYTISEEAPVGANTPEAVADAAARRLTLEYMSRRSGNVVFNGAASEKKAALVDLSPGDFIGTPGGTVGGCRRAISAGVYMVQTVQHHISGRHGWTVTVEVAEVPTASISTESYIYNPEKEERWEDLAEYIAESGDLPVTGPFGLDPF
jgi:hypothetical protein